MLLQEDISDKELKQRWRLYWIQCVFEFSNTRLQRMSWIEGSETDWPSSFEGSLSAYFDDLALDDAYAKAFEWGNVSQEEVDQAKALHHQVLFYEEPSEDPHDVLNDAEWMKVVEAAKKFWDYLKTSVTSQREIDLMRKLEKEYPRD